MSVYLEKLKQVIETERDALTVLAENSEAYEEVISFLANCKGKIVFMGVGKSGHIGKKLAATFASLGVSSFFVHSTEAMHGDLGMIESRDIAILISNSGNTQEVTQNIQPLRNNGVTTVAFTSGQNSVLATECDYKILYPKLREADDLNLAPTVSSTVTLALGDAIACAISASRDFSRREFLKFHPNGELGATLKEEQKNG